jgi:hypothetical protein
MNCPIDRGGCGKRLSWDDGAFCKECIQKAKIKIQEEEDTPIFDDQYNYFLDRVDNQ